MKQPEKYYRLPPCPKYDLETLESWLTDLATQGLMLQKITLGIFVFQKSHPCHVRYRLEAVQIGNSILDDDNSKPDEDMLDAAESCGWSFVAKYAEFYIYLTANANAVELNTDPTVQALSLNALKKRQRTSIIVSVIDILILFPLFGWHLLLNMLNNGSFFVLALLFGVITTTANEITALIHLRKLQKKLITQEPLNHTKPWQPGMRSFRAKQLINFLILFVLIISYGNWVWVHRIAAANISLDVYTEPIPFVTIEDLEATQISYGTICVWSDPLAPTCIQYNQSATGLRTDGSEKWIQLNIQYYETISPLIAEQVAKEIVSSERILGQIKALGGKNWFAMEQAPDVDANFVSTFIDMNGNVTIVLQTEKVVVKASGRSFDKTLWATLMADIMRQKSP